MAEYIVENRSRGLSVERGTKDVPADGRYHVVADGEIVLSTKVEAAALAEYEDLKSNRQSEGQKRLQRESEAADVRAHQRDAWAAKATRDGRKGGRGVGRR